MSEKQKVVVQSFPVASILGIVFVTLKLLGKLTWSWWAVTAPFWAPVAVMLAVFVIAFFILVIDVIVKALASK